MENGTCAYLPKYKRRRVSAVRDYPPGCGRFAPPIVPKPTTEDACVEWFDNSVHREMNADVVSNDSVAFTGSKHESLFPGLQEGVSSFVLNEQTNGTEFVADHSKKSHQEIGSRIAKFVPQIAGLEAFVDERVVEPVKALDSEDTGVSSKVDDTSRVTEVVQRKYPPRRKISAIRDFPPSCRRSSPRVVKEKCGEVQGGEVFPHTETEISGQGKSCIEECEVKETVKTDTKHMGVDVPGRYPQSSRIKRNFCALSKDNVQAESESLTVVETDNTDKLELFYQNEIHLAQADVQEKTGVESLKSSNHKNKVLDDGPSKQGQVDCRSNKSGSFMSELRRHKAAIKKKKKEEHFKGTETSLKKNSSLTRKSFQDLNQVTQRNKVNVEHGKALSNNHSDSEAGGDGVSDARRKVKEVLDLYRNICNELMKESNSKRIDLEAAKILKERGKYVNVGKQITGSVPGVEVGDKFNYWVELNIVGLHRQSQGGIDYVKEGQLIRATSIVASGSYDDDTVDSNVLIYTGAGGNMLNGKKEPEDQKLERGNLALKNSMDTKKPVRVIRGVFRSSDARKTYFYDGLYRVESYWQEKGPHGKLIFKFKLVRDPDQPVVKKLKKL